MHQRDVSTFSKRMTILIGLVVVSAMTFGLAVSFYRNLLFEQTLEGLSGRNRKLREEIDEGLDELAYYRSAQYRDKYAKENLGRMNPGEKLLILGAPAPAFPMEALAGPSRKEQQEAAYREYLQALPVLEHWRLYLLANEELLKLKGSF